MKTNGTLQIIYGTAAELQAMDPVLRPDQAGVELSADEIPVLLRFGDGAKAWNDLVEGQLYIGSGGGLSAAITSINLNVGPAIELRIPLDAMWAQIFNAGAPAAGEVEASSDGDATAVTSITFHKTDAGANDQSAWFAQMRIGGNLTVRMTNNDGTNASGTPVVYRITAVPSLASDRYTIAVSHVSGVFLGTLPIWYVSYAGNEQTQFYNGTAVQLQEAIITGLTDGSGRLAIDMSGSPYNWTTIYDAQVTQWSGEVSNIVGYSESTANTGRATVVDAADTPLENIPLHVLLKGI